MTKPEAFPYKWLMFFEMSFGNAGGVAKAHKVLKPNVELVLIADLLQV